MPGPEDLAALSKKLREQADSTSERKALLDRLAAEIRSGNYHVDVEKLADRLLHDISGQRRADDQHE